MTIRDCETFLLEGRFWWIKAALATTLLSLLIAAPDFERLGNGLLKEIVIQQSDFQAERESWTAFHVKYQNPLADTSDMGWGSYHDKKQTFRVTPFLVPWLTGTGGWGMRAVNYMVTFGSHLLTVLLAWRIFGDRRIAFWTGLLLATVFFGYHGYAETGLWLMMYPYFFIMACLVARNSLLLISSSLLGCYTDERFILVLPVLCLLRSLLDFRQPLELRTVFCRSSVMIGVGFLIYAITRLAMTFGWGYGTDVAGIREAVLVGYYLTVGFITMLVFKTLLPGGIWLGARLWDSPYRASGVWLFLAMLPAALTSWAVDDHSKSLAMVTPLFFGLILMHHLQFPEKTPLLQRFIGFAIVINMLIPCIHKSWRVEFHEIPNYDVALFYDSLPVAILRGIFNLLN